MISNLADNTVNNKVIHKPDPASQKVGRLKYVTVQKLHFSYYLFNVIQRNIWFNKKRNSLWLRN